MIGARAISVRGQTRLAMGVAGAFVLLGLAFYYLPRLDLVLLGAAAGAGALVFLRYPVAGAVLVVFTVFAGLSAFIPKITSGLLLATLAIILVTKLFAGDFTWRLSPVARWGLLLCAFNLVSFLWTSRYDYFHVGHILRVVLVILVLSEVISTPREFLWVIVAAAVGTAFTGVMTIKSAIAFFTTGAAVELSGMVRNVKESRFGGHWAEFNMMALALAPVIALSYAVIRTKIAGVGSRLVLLVSSLLAVAGVILSLSRGGLICLVASLFVVISADRRRWIIGLISVALILAVLSVLPVEFFGRVGTLFAGRADASIGHRSKLIEAGFEMFKNHPLLGIGYGSFRWASSDYIWPQHTGFIAHNSYIETLAETGLVGLFLHLGVLATAFAAVRFHVRRLEPNDLNRNLGVGLGGALAAVVLGMGTLSATFYTPFWIILTLIGIRKAVFAESSEPGPAARAT